MRQVFEFRKQSAQVGHKHRAGHFAGRFTPRGHLKGKAQNPVDHQHGHLVLDLLRVPRILDLAQALQQNRQLSAIGFDLLSSRHPNARRLLFSAVL